MIETHRQYAERSYPMGKVTEKRKIIRCSDPNAWYSAMVGQIIDVHFFATFGAWDTEDRWIDYYDLSMPVKWIPTPEEKDKLMQQEKKLIEQALAELRKWEDIPMSWQVEGISKLLKIEYNKAAENFCYKILMLPIDESSELLYKCRQYEFSERPKELESKKSLFKRLFT